MRALPTQFGAEDFVIFCELGFTLDQIKAQFCVTDAHLEALAREHWPEDGGAENSRARRRAAGPMHLIRLAYLQAETNPKLLQFLLERLWKPVESTGSEVVANSLSDTQLAQIHGIIRGSLT